MPDRARPSPNLQELAEANRAGAGDRGVPRFQATGEGFPAGMNVAPFSSEPFQVVHNLAVCSRREGKPCPLSMERPSSASSTTRTALWRRSALRRAGFTDAQIGLASRQAAGEPELSQVDTQQHAGNAAITGAAVGGGIGAVAGAVAVSVIPVVGPFLAGGLLAGALGGAALGAAVGTFAGPFIALGMSEHDAQNARHVEAGRNVVMVRTADRLEVAREILDQHGAYDDSMRAKPE